MLRSATLNIEPQRRKDNWLLIIDICSLFITHLYYDFRVMAP